MHSSPSSSTQPMPSASSSGSLARGAIRRSSLSQGLPVPATPPLPMPMPLTSSPPSHGHSYLPPPPPPISAAGIALASGPSSGSPTRRLSISALPSPILTRGLTPSPAFGASLASPSATLTSASVVPGHHKLHHIHAHHHPQALPPASASSSRRGSAHSFSEMSPTDPSFHKFFTRKLSVSPHDVRVLVVDADLGHARAVAAQLANAGYPVDAVNSSTNALARLRAPGPVGLVGGCLLPVGVGSDADTLVGALPASPSTEGAVCPVPLPPGSDYSLVICDISSVSGLELLRAVRSEPDWVHLPFIMMATVDEMDLAYSSLRSGADDYLVKPVKPEAVRGIWRSVWRKRKEKSVLQLLEEERAKRKTLEHQVESLEHQVSAAVETPLNLITRAVSTLLHTEATSMSAAARASLRGVLDGLKTSNLYRPAFERVLTRDDVDAETKLWLASEVLRDGASTNNPGTGGSAVGGNGGSTVNGANGTSAPASPLLRVRRVSTLQSVAARRKLERSGSISSVTTLPAAMEDHLMDHADPIATLKLPANLPEPTHMPLLNSWNLDVWSYTHAELLVFIADMFADLGLLEHFRIDPATFLEFLKDIEIGYKQNPYHNFRHAFDVTQAAYLFLRTCCVSHSDESYTPPNTDYTTDHHGSVMPPTPTSLGFALSSSSGNNHSANLPMSPTAASFASSMLAAATAASPARQRKLPRLLFTLTEQLALMVACVCHDLRHDGKTNSFHITTASPLAQQYNDQSPLENMHMHSAALLIAKHNLLAAQSRAVQQEIRSIMVRCILSTDLAKHVDILAKFNEICPSYSNDDKEHRVRSLEMIIKCADVSNVVRPLHLAKGWADCIQEEMFCQGDVERELELPISGFGDRVHPQPARLGVTFADYMVAPLFQTMGKAITGMETYLRNIAVTRDYWAGVLQAEVAAAAAVDAIDEVSSQSGSSSGSSSSTVTTGQQQQPRLAMPSPSFSGSTVGLAAAGSSSSSGAGDGLTITVATGGPTALDPHGHHHHDDSESAAHLASRRSSSRSVATAISSVVSPTVLQFPPLLPADLDKVPHLDPDQVDLH
ncbi:hypothetical protein BC828DRAFT_437542 [Blastocladiella britannica]|nr:hypothetical protein BC828DRAFT_437542 [Blastocladiella britannica]